MWRTSIGIVAGLITTLLLAIFFLFFAKPTASLPYEPYSYLGVLLIVELFAFLGAKLLTAGGYRGAIVKSLLMAVFTSALLYYILKPSAYASFDLDLLIVFALEMIGLILGTVLTSRPSQGAYR